VCVRACVHACVRVSVCVCVCKRKMHKPNPDMEEIETKVWETTPLLDTLALKANLSVRK